MSFRVSKAQFQQWVEEALEELPEDFREFLEEVPIQIVDLPTPKQLRDAEMNPDHLLLGLYVGNSLAGRSVEQPFRYPEIIYLFQENLQTVCNNEQELKHEVRKTVLHEIGHHFGLNEDDLDELGYG